MVALALPALLQASLWWAAAWLSGCLVGLGVALLGIVYRDGPRRAFWIGFAVFGWGYMIAVYGPVLDRHIGVRLVTTKALAYAQLHGAFNRSPKLVIGSANKFHLSSCLNSDRPKPRKSPFTGDDGYIPPQWDFFQQVGHSVFAILLACVGGFVSQWFHATRSRG